MLRELIGSLTAVYTQTQYAAGATPRLGQVYFDEKNCRKYIFLKNSGATAIAAQEITMSLTTDKSSFFCSLSAATDALRPFAGVRAVGATSMAQNEYGWFQISGSATFTHSGGQASVAEEGLVSSATTAGRVEGEASGPFTIGSHPGVFAVAEAAVSTAVDVKGSITRNIWGV